MSGAADAIMVTMISVHGTGRFATATATANGSSACDVVIGIGGLFQWIIQQEHLNVPDPVGNGGISRLRLPEQPICQ